MGSSVKKQVLNGMAFSILVGLDGTVEILGFYE